MTKFTARRLGRRWRVTTRSAVSGSSARSGDKGGSANVGVWVRTDEQWRWLAHTLTVEKLRELLPETADLPEFMPEAEFKRRFGGIGAPAYQRMMQDIERRVAACPLYR